MQQFDLGRMFNNPSIGERLTAKGVRPDLAQAAERTASDVRLDRTVAALQLLIPEQESVQAMVLGRHLRAKGLLVLTQEQVLFLPIDTTTPTFATDRAEVIEVSPAGSRLRIRTTAEDVVIDRMLGRSADIFAAAYHRLD